MDRCYLPFLSASDAGETHSIRQPDQAEIKMCLLLGAEDESEGEPGGKIHLLWLSSSSSPIARFSGGDRDQRQNLKPSVLNEYNMSLRFVCSKNTDHDMFWAGPTVKNQLVNAFCWTVSKFLVFYGSILLFKGWHIDGYCTHGRTF